jgi:predicted anti-sigma-YlaC factor YlaD
MRRGRRRSGEPDCEAVRQAISARLDGEPAGVAEPDLAAHLDGCPGCQRFSAGAVSLAGMIGLQASHGAPEDLHRRLAFELAHVTPSRPAWLARWRRTGATMAWRRRVRWVGAVAPVALMATFVPLGALASPHEIPSHAPTPCTISLPDTAHR